jgi:hypothetical protein
MNLLTESVLYKTQFNVCFDLSVKGCFALTEEMDKDLMKNVPANNINSNTADIQIPIKFQVTELDGKRSVHRSKE